jgi:hypothetical protein
MDFGCLLNGLPGLPLHPGKEADAAKALIDQGADILTQHTDSPAATQIAEQRGVHSFGQSSDMIRFGAKAQLTADTDYCGGYYTKRANDVLDGKWRSEDTWGGLDSGMVVMAPYTNMPDDVKKMAMDTEESIRSGKFHPFKRPVLASSIVQGGGKRRGPAVMLLRIHRRAFAALVYSFGCGPVSGPGGGGDFAGGGEAFWFGCRFPGCRFGVGACSANGPSPGGGP